MTAYIYALLDPDTKRIRYIGRTVQPLIPNRLLTHINESLRKSRSHLRPKSQWVRELLARGKSPLITLVEECSTDGWSEEVYHIGLARRDGIDLLNVSIGGRGPTGFRHTPEFRAAQAARRKNAKASPETCARISAANKGRKVGPEGRARMSASALGKIIGPETRVKMGDAVRRRWQEGRFDNRKSPAQPGERNPAAKLTAANVVEIRRRCASGESQYKVASSFGIRQTTVSKIVQRQAWMHVL